MKLRILTVTLFLLALATTVLVLGGCNTWEGAGKDVERAGEKMQGDE